MSERCAFYAEFEDHAWMLGPDCGTTCCDMEAPRCGGCCPQCVDRLTDGMEPLIPREDDAA
jgi:hypothetical protein